MADKDSEIEQLARDELLREAKNAKKRTETFGATSWQGCPLPKTNKRFLHNMLLATRSRSDAKQTKAKVDRSSKKPITPRNNKNSTREAQPPEDKVNKHSEAKKNCKRHSDLTSGKDLLKPRKSSKLQDDDD